MNDPRFEEMDRDGNGVPYEHVWLGGQEVLVHYDDVPETDIDVIDGMRVTTPLRTVIDLSAELRPAELERMAEDCLRRGLFDVDGALARLAEPDMLHREGARALRDLLGRERERWDAIAGARGPGRPNRRERRRRRS